MASLGQAAYSRTFPNILNGVLTTNRLARVDSPLARALGATDLTPEESTNFSTGLVWSIGQRGSLTADVYHIDIDDRIVLSEVLRGPLVTEKLTEAGFPTFAGLQFFTNAADTRTQGIDLTARYGFRLQGGTLDLSLGYNRSKTEITGVKPAPDVLAGSGLELIGRESAGIIERSQPPSFVHLAADYVRGPLDVNVSAVRYGTYEAIHPTNPALDQVFSSQVVANLNAGYRFNDLLKAMIGVRNLFDSKPDQVLPGARNPTVALYSGLSPEGAAGTVYYARLNFSFQRIETGSGARTP